MGQVAWDRLRHVSLYLSTIVDWRDVATLQDNFQSRRRLASVRQLVWRLPASSLWDNAVERIAESDFGLVGSGELTAVTWQVSSLNRPFNHVAASIHANETLPPYSRVPV